MFKSLKTKMVILLFTLISIPLILLGTFSYLKTANSVQALIESNLKATSKDTSMLMKEKMNSAEDTLKALSSDSKLKQLSTTRDENLKKEVFNYFLELKKNNSVILNFTLVDSEGKAIVSNENINDDTDLSTREYAKKALKGEISRSEMLLSLSTGKPICAVAAPLKENEKVVGLLVADIKFSDISKFAEEVKIGKGGYAYVLDENGKILYHPDQKKVLKENIHDTKEAGGIFDKTKSANEAHGYYTYNGVKKYVNFKKDSGMVLAITADYNEYMEPAIKIRNSTIMFAAVFILLASILAYRIATKNIINPIIHLEDLMSKAGEGDLTVKANVKTGDEIEQLAASFDKMIGNQKEIVLNIIRSSGELVASSEEIAASSEEISSSTEEITASMEQVSLDAERQNKAIVETSEVLVQLSSLVQLAQNKALGSQENSTKAMDIANFGRDKVNLTVKSMEDITISTTRTSNMLKALEELSKKVEGIVVTINGIAEQTNLLALNAAIEAARAGENGKGFAVVADEVRKLSEESNTGASEIAMLIKDMVTEINGAVDSMEESKKVIESGVNIVNETDESFLKIISAVEKISLDVEKIVEITKDEVASSEKVIKLIDSVATISETTASHSTQVAAAAEEQASTTENLAAAAEESSSMATSLNGMVERFKIH